MSPLKQSFYLGGAFALCFFVGGWSCWRGSYQQYLETGFNWQTFLLPAGAAVGLSWLVGARIVPSALAVGIAFPAIIMTRVALDCLQDPTNHNLWPFELAIAFFLGMVTAFPAAAIGGLLRRMTHRSRP